MYLFSLNIYVYVYYNIYHCLINIIQFIILKIKKKSKKKKLSVYVFPFLRGSKRNEEEKRKIIKKKTKKMHRQYKHSS